ncbi:MAG: KH domain-containing protein [Clostridia bacterium]|nr:KH domain-containing protein [Clostridia bacterium]
MKDILVNIAKAIVDSPDEVTVTETVEGDEIKLTLTVAPDDTGMVIGRHGRIAKAIRSVMKAVGGGKHIIVEIE